MQEVIIDLDNSLYARGFNNNDQIHLNNLEKAQLIIKEHYDLINKAEDEKKKRKEDDCIYMDHQYRTIAILGDRGSGKTSFLITLLEKCKRTFQEMEVLQIIDPTLAEYKKPMILCIISMINQLVQRKLKKNECSPGGNAFSDRVQWTKVLKRVSLGTPAVDEIGEKYYNNTLWQDEEYVLHTGLSRVNEANKFEENLRIMIGEALRILEKKAFIISFDDIDMDINKGWNVLECLRRFLSDIHIISIVSGNFKLYEMLVKKNLCEHLSIKNDREKAIMENELGGQYMLKLLPPANRINLQSLRNLIQQGNPIRLKSAGSQKPQDIDEIYSNVLKMYKIGDISSQQLFKDFLLSMSLRTQIHFIKDALKSSESELPLDIFASRLYDRGIDMEVLKGNAQLTNLTILNYLWNRGELSECYLLLPVMADKDSNSILTALTLIECKHFEKHPFLIFDYMLRIGYIRNLTFSLVDPHEIKNLCRYGGWDQIMSLKNSLGLTLAYVAGKSLGDMKEHIKLYGMEKKAKDNVNDALDKALRNSDLKPIQKLLASFPSFGIVHNKNNESQNFYSLYAVLGIIGEILKQEDENGIIECINDLKLFRSYQMPQDGNSHPTQNSSFEEDIFLIEPEQSGVEELASLMQKWKKQYNKAYLPPYVVGRIMTRLYTASKNIIERSVGKRMKWMVANFFNACLIEESRIKIDNPIEQNQINNNNLRTSTEIFTDNLKKADNIEKVDIKKQLDFTKWIISCPMLNCFLDLETWNKICEFVLPNSVRYEVYDILAAIGSKDIINTSEKPSFSGSKIGWRNSAIVLLHAGIDVEIIKKNMSLDEVPIDSAVSFIKNTNLFSKINRSSVKSFSQNCNYDELKPIEKGELKIPNKTDDKTIAADENDAPAVIDNDSLPDTDEKKTDSEKEDNSKK